MPGRVVALARLNDVLRFLCERYFQGVKVPVELEILRRKSKHIGNLGRRYRPLHSNVEIVAIVKKGPARSVGELAQDDSIFELLRHTELRTLARSLR